MISKSIIKQIEELERRFTREPCIVKLKRQITPGDYQHWEYIEADFWEWMENNNPPGFVFDHAISGFSDKCMEALIQSINEDVLGEDRRTENEKQL